MATPSQAPSWLLQHSSLDSTNSWALERLDSLNHGDVVYTRQQTAGRGQHGRSWHSPDGVLTCSYIVDLHTTAAATFSLVAGLAVADAINDRAQADQLAIRCQIKWPNDVMLGSAKVAGILCEGRATPKSGQRIVVGVGCNLSPDLSNIPLSRQALTATSLQAHGIDHHDSLGLVAAIRDYLLQGAALLNLGRWQALLSRIREHDWLLGRHLEIMDGPRQYQGYAAGIDDVGHLLLTQPDGGHIAISGGRIQPSVSPHED